MRLPWYRRRFDRPPKVDAKTSICYGLKARMPATPDQQISLTDPDARSMATSRPGVRSGGLQCPGRGRHRIPSDHYARGDQRRERPSTARPYGQKDAGNTGSNGPRCHCRGYFSSEEILACDKAGITVTLPKPMTSNAKAEGRFGKQDFRFVAELDRSSPITDTTEENGLALRRYWTNACQNCTIKNR